MDFGWIALGIYRLLLGFRTGALLASLPLLLFSLGGSPAEISLGFALPVSIALLLLPVLGYYSDRVGQRRLILFTELASVLIFFALQKIDNPIILLVLMSLATGAMRIAHPIALAGVSKSGRKGLILGILKTLGDLAVIGGMLVGTAVLALGSSTILTVLGAVSLPALTLSFFIPESKTRKKGNFLREIQKVITWPIIAAVLWIGSGAMVEQSWDPLTKGLSTEMDAGFLALAVSATLLGATISAGILLDKHSRFLAQICILIDTILLLLAPLTGNFILLGIIRLARIIPYALQGLLAQKTALDRKGNFGLSIATTGALLLIAETFFPLAGRIAADLGGYIGVYWLAAIFSGAALLILKYY